MSSIGSVIAVLHLFAALGIFFRAVMSMCAVDYMRWDEAVEKARCDTNYHHTGDK
jgi:hypothetical protein